MEKDIIDKAILQKKHISSEEILNGQSWEQFEEHAKEKKIVLFGVSAVAWSYFERYGENARVDILIDNSKKKQGYCLNDYFMTAPEKTEEDIVVKDQSVLKDYNPEELVVLVASTNYYVSIIKQLREMGIQSCFSILNMEAKVRSECADRDSNAEKKRKFAIECCEKELVNKKKILFRSFGSFSDHEKYITLALLGIRPDLEIVWIVNDLSVEMPEGIRKVSFLNWKQYIYEMETAGMWVLDLEVPSYIQKRQGQIYVQTKHWASVTLKKFYLDAVTFESVPERIENWKRNGEILDYIIAGSEFDVNSCKRGFGFDGPFIMAGSPRTDGVFKTEQSKKKVYEHLGIESSVKTLLYAPTYRFDKKLGKNFHNAIELEMDFLRIKEALEKRFGGEWAFVLRLHPSVASAWEKADKQGYVYDASRYEDSQELVAACDITVSDFSSIMFEPAFAKKKVILFVGDLEDYLANEYELLIDYRTLPFPIAETNDQLEQCILGFDEDAYIQKVSDFLEKYGVCEDGHASERAAQFISDIIDGKEV